MSDHKFSAEELVDRVKRLLSGEWNDDEMEELFDEIDRSVPCPFSDIQELIFHTDGLSPEEIVDRLLAYRAIQL